jgi:acetyl-CoA C-acetyltransferase
LLARQSFEPGDFDEVVLGCVMPGPDEANIARVVALRLGCGKHVPAFTVQRNCGSGLQAIDSAAHDIASGRVDLVLAGGTESMSYAPLMLSKAMVTWLGKLNMARNVGSKLKSIVQFRLGLLKPVIAILRGLTDPIVGLSMGQTAEELAYRFNISREQMDSYAVRSHERLAAAYAAGRLYEVEVLYDAKLRPGFDRGVGLVTAGNSAQVTDGAAWVVLACESAVKKYQLPVLARIVDSEWAGLDPGQMGLGPVHAMTPLMKRQKIKIEDIDYWEINEAFAAQILACLAAWQDKDYCRNELHLRSVMGEIDQDILNVDGGGISLGHPVGASGARIVLHICHLLQDNKKNRGIASLCIGGGQGGAMLLERDAA